MLGSVGAIDYQARHHDIDFTMFPYYDLPQLPFEVAKGTLELSYSRTVLEVERNNSRTTGLDALSARPARNDTRDPVLPIPSGSKPNLTLDIEGMVINPDGTWALFIFRSTSL